MRAAVIVEEGKAECVQKFQRAAENPKQELHTLGRAEIIFL